MERLRVNELFSGIGAFRKALQNLKIPHEVVGISEIDKHAIMAYEAIYGKTRNYGDISAVEKLDRADLWVYGFPCQDVSNEGGELGIIKNKTRSGLLYEVARLLSVSQAHDELPSYLVMENVKNLVSKKFMGDFTAWLTFLEELGYSNRWQVLNAKDFGIPQNRERVFCVSVLGNEKHVFPEKQTLNKTLKDMLEVDVDNAFYLSNQEIEKIEFRDNETDWRSSIKIKNATKIGYIRAVDGDAISLQFPNSKTRRGRVQRQMAHTLTTQAQEAVVEVTDDEIRIRKLTPREYWRLMGFDDDDFEKAASVCSNTQLYKQAGNSIVVSVAESVLSNLLMRKRE